MGLHSIHLVFVPDQQTGCRLHHAEVQSKPKTRKKRTGPLTQSKHYLQFLLQKPWASAVPHIPECILYRSSHEIRFTPRHGCEVQVPCWAEI